MPAGSAGGEVRLVTCLTGRDPAVSKGDKSMQACGGHQCQLPGPALARAPHCNCALQSSWNKIQTP